MPPTALLITHTTRPGRRDDVQAVWARHLQPAIADNAGHLDYHYCFDATDPDTVHAFQRYRSVEDAQAFLETAAYAAYEREVAPLLMGTVVTRLAPVWTRPTG